MRRVIKMLCVAAIVGLAVAASEPAAAQAPSLPPNTDCSQAAVVAKLSVVEDRAAANVMAEALAMLGSRGRCLVDAGNPDSGHGPPADARSALASASSVFVIGGPAALPDEWLADRLGVRAFVRVHGCDRWATQSAVARAALALARGDSVPGWVPCGSGTGELPPNLNCFLGGAVVAKLSQVEDRAAANMLAEAKAWTSRYGDDRCLIDAGDPQRGVAPTLDARTQAQWSGAAVVVGGSEALPSAWLMQHFGDVSTRRVAGADRWGTQAAIARELVELGRTKPEAVGEREVADGLPDVVLHGDPPDGDGLVLTDQVDFSDVVVPVHLCAAAGTFDDDDLAREVRLLNDRVVPWYESQFGDSGAAIRFRTGTNVQVPAADWPTGTLDSLREDDKKLMPDHSCSRASLRSQVDDSARPLAHGLIIVDVPLESIAGFAYIGGPAFLGHRKHYPSDENYLAVAAHEIGHSRYRLRHVWVYWMPAVSDEAGCDRIRKAAANDEVKPNNEVKQRELKSLMSWPGCGAIRDLRDGKGAFLACSQRRDLGWLAAGESCGQSAPAPGAPTLTQVEPGDGSLTLRWNAPAGPAPIVDYDVRYRPSDRSSPWVEWNAQDISTRRTATITGLANGVQYEVSVWAHNNDAGGPQSNLGLGTPQAPQAPPTPPPADVSVSLSIGGDASAYCSDVHCRWLAVDVQGLGSGPHSLLCVHNGVAGRFSAGVFEQAEVSAFPNGDSCYFGFPGADVYVIVGGEYDAAAGIVRGGHYSNTIRWPNCTLEPARCNAGSPAPGLPTPPQADVSVSLSIGGDASAHCSDVHCRWLAVDVQGLGSGPHSLLCVHNGVAGRFSAGVFEQAEVSAFPNGDSCYFGFPGADVYVIVGGEYDAAAGIVRGGHYSNTIRWPNCTLEPARCKAG